MDAFEAARLKHAKNLAARQRSLANSEVQEAPIIVEAPRESQKESRDAAISVTVSMPNKTLSFTLTRRDILNNVSPSRLTTEEFKKYIRNGLTPLLGETT